MSTTPRPRPRLVRVITALTLGALAVSGLTALGTESPPPAAAFGSFGTLSVGSNPRGIAVSPNGDVAVVANRVDGSVTVIDIDTAFTPAETITVGGEPRDVTISPDGTEAWVTTWSPDRIAVIDLATRQETDSIALSSGPLSVIFSHDGTTAWVTDLFDAQILVVDAATKSVLRGVTGTYLTQPQSGILSSDGSVLAFTMSNGAYGRMSTADETFEITSAGSFMTGIAATADESEHWLIDSVGFQIVIVDPADGSVIDTVPTSDDPFGITLSQSGTQMLVSTSVNTEVFDVATRELVATLPISGVGEIEAVPGQNRYLRVSDNSNTVAVIGFDQERLAGPDRFATAVEVSKTAYPSGASVVFVASGRDFPDALAAGPASANLGGPLLLTNTTVLPSVVAEELERLNPDTIYIVGGTSVVSTAVENALKAIQPTTVRLAGSNRYATGAAVVAEAWEGETVAEVFIATGRNYPDALSAGAVAAAEGIPVILVDGARTSVPQSTIDLIRDLGPTQITIAGGPSVVSAAIEAQLGVEFTGVRRLAGADRYATSAAISLDAYPTNFGVIYATGTGFADALAGATLAGRAEMPVYLVKPTCVPVAAIDAIYSGTTTNLFLLGGTGALSEAVASLTPCP